MTVDIGQGLLNALLYMGPLAIIGGLVCLYLWERTCRLKIKVILVKEAGGTVPYYVDKEGSSVTLSNAKTGWTATWPISDLATIPQPYPDLAGFLPKFLQREIQTAIYIEGDVEPVLNRSSHRSNVMSPNVYNLLMDIADGCTEDDPVRSKIVEITAKAATGPTRELIASPDWVGALRKSTALKALASVSDELLDALKGIRNQLARFSGLNSTYVYIGLALILVMVGIDIYYTVQLAQVTEITDQADLIEKVDSIRKALGVTGQ